MAALNFPTTGLVAGVTEYSANGTTYLWDGVKWVGRTAGGAAGTNSIQNNEFTVQVDAGGNLVLPAFSMPNTVGTTGQVLKWPASGSTLTWANDNNSGGGAGTIWTNDANGCLRAELSSTGFEAYTSASHLYLQDGGEWHVGSNQNSTSIGNDQFSNLHTLSLRSGDETYITTNLRENGNYQWQFGNTGTLTLPEGGAITSPDYNFSFNKNPGDPAIPTLGTDITTIGEGDIATGEVYMGSGYGEFRSIFNKGDQINSGLVYAGVEGFNYVQYGDVNFAGMVSQTPNIDSMYALSLNEQGQIVIGFTQAGQTQTSTDWSVVVGTLTTDYTVNGLFANTARTVISSSGTNGIELTTNRGTVLFGNQPEAPLPTDSHHWHIMPADSSATDLFFGNDTNYVKLPRGTGDVVIGAEGPEWKFGSDGILNLPNNNGQIGALTAPYTGLEFRTGAGADWIGISYGEINDNNTSYFYFDKDGSNYLTANHRAHLQLKNPAHNGHVEWLFDSSGNLTLPAGGDILDSTGQSVLGAGGNGTANRVQFANAGSISQVEDDEPNRYNIVINAEKDVVIQTNESEQEFRFTSTGNLKLPQGSTISDQAESVGITVYHPSESAYWYNLFGDTGATTYANVAINGSVVHDAGGNVYVLGSTTGVNFNNNNNLFLKYSPLGELLWRRTWTDSSGLSCGSYNASLRYIEANVVLGTQDTILWAAQTPDNRISYVGTMDMEGNMVDQFGTPRLPVRLDNFAVTDLESADTIGAPYVVVVGQLYVNGTGLNYPTFAGIDLDTAEIVGDITVAPAGTDLTAGLYSANPWANMFKALTVLPPVGLLPSISALVGSYYDGSHTHAMVTLQAGAGPLTVGIGVDNHGSDDVIGEDICCDANGNVYVIVNNISSNYAVLVKGNAGSIVESGSVIWQRRIGDLSGSDDSFYATAVTYSSGHVYVLGQFYQDSLDDTDVMLIKLNEYTGNIVWSRRIHSAGDDGLNFVGAPGWESSSGIHVQDGLIVISFATEARTKNLNQYGPDLNTVTLQYPQDGSLLGTFGDFEITDFEPAIGSIDYSITALTTTSGEIYFTSGFATLQATTAAVGTGWTNTQWDMDLNQEVYPTQTFKFMTDGTFDTPEIKHQTEVKITANTTVANATPSTWTFQNNDGLRFPDGSVQYGAYVETEMALDGGFAGSAYNVVPRPTSADGGGSSSRHGVSDPVYDGSSGENYVLDGGGA